MAESSFDKRTELHRQVNARMHPGAGEVGATSRNANQRQKAERARATAGLRIAAEAGGKSTTQW